MYNCNAKIGNTLLRETGFFRTNEVTNLAQTGNIEFRT